MVRHHSSLITSVVYLDYMAPLLGGCGASAGVQVIAFAETPALFGLYISDNPTGGFGKPKRVPFRFAREQFCQSQCWQCYPNPTWVAPFNVFLHSCFLPFSRM